MKQSKKKKSKFRPFKQLRPSQWLAVDTLRDNAHVIKGIAASYLVKSPNATKKNTANKSFEEVMQEYGQTEEGLKKCVVDCKKIITFCSIFGIAILCYSIYLLTKTQILAGIITFLLSLNMAAYAFRESFTIHQIKKRSVNVSFKDWLQNLLKKDPR